MRTWAAVLACALLATLIAPETVLLTVKYVGQILLALLGVGLAAAMVIVAAKRLSRF